jgi:hypothetical protein
LQGPDGATADQIYQYIEANKQERLFDGWEGATKLNIEGLLKGKYLRKVCPTCTHA